MRIIKVSLTTYIYAKLAQIRKHQTGKEEILRSIPTGGNIL